MYVLCVFMRSMRWIHHGQCLTSDSSGSSDRPLGPHATARTYLLQGLLIMQNKPPTHGTHRTYRSLPMTKREVPLPGSGMAEPIQPASTEWSLSAGALDYGK